MKLLIELPSWLGDTVMVTPAIENLIKYLDNPKVTVIGSTTSTQLFNDFKLIDKALIIDKNIFNYHKLFKGIGEFDYYFSFRGSFRSNLMKLFVPSKKKFQYSKKKYTNGHQVEKYSNFVNDSLGINALPGNLVLRTSNKKMKLKNKKLLGINPGAAYGNAKRWLPSEFAKVAVELANEYDIVIFGGSKELDIADDIEKYLILNGIENFNNLTSRTSINELIENISNLDLFITGDSGPMHIAAAFQIPTISIFGPTDDSVTSQWMNKKNIIIKKDLNCQPCLKRSCPLKHNNCMKLIDSSDVLIGVSKLD